MISRIGDAAVAVFAADWQLIWWKRTCATLLGDPSAKAPQLRNFARDTFPVGPDNASHLSQWPVVSADDAGTAAAVVSDLRRATGRFPQDRRLAALVRELTGGITRFPELWATGAVGTHREDRKVIEHPTVGPVLIDCDVVTDGDAELKIVTAVPDPDDETKVR